MRDGAGRGAVGDGLRFGDATRPAPVAPDDRGLCRRLCRGLCLAPWGGPAHTCARRPAGLDVLLAPNAAGPLLEGERPVRRALFVVLTLLVVLSGPLAALSDLFVP